MTDNFELIKGLLDWKSEDDFFFLQILQRKKDHGAGKINGTNNNSRLVKAYYVKSLEHLDFLVPEIIQLCEVFGARAGINLNRRSFKKMQLLHMKKCLDQLLNGTHNKVHKAYNTVVGSVHHDGDKKWILDFDYPLAGDEADIEEFIEALRPVNVDGKCKILAKIPSKNGYHLITTPFDLSIFKKRYSNVEVHKNNPTNLYIP